MNYLLSIYIALLGFVVLIVDSNIVTRQNGINNINLDCSKFQRDLDVLRSFSYPVQINPLIKNGKTYAIMNSNSEVVELHIYYQINLPLEVFCLIHLNTLQVNNTPFVSHLPLDNNNNNDDDNTIINSLSPLISRLNQLRILSLINTTASYIHPQSLSLLTNITILEINNCGLREIPSTISLLTNIEQLKLPNNHLNSIPQINALHQMSKLTDLDLSHNKIKDITDLAQIASRSVVSMDFSYNEIDYIPPEISEFYYQLKYLYLNDNKLNYLPSDIFKLLYLRKAAFDRNLFPTDEINAIKAQFKSSFPYGTVTI